MLSSTKYKGNNSQWTIEVQGVVSFSLHKQSNAKQSTTSKVTITRQSRGTGTK